VDSVRRRALLYQTNPKNRVLPMTWVPDVA
jgi:hypothetical protein